MFKFTFKWDIRTPDPVSKSDKGRILSPNNSPDGNKTHKIAAI